MRFIRTENGLINLELVRQIRPCQRKFTGSISTTYEDDPSKTSFVFDDEHVVVIDMPYEAASSWILGYNPTF